MILTLAAIAMSPAIDGASVLYQPVNPVEAVATVTYSPTLEPEPVATRKP